MKYFRNKLVPFLLMMILNFFCYISSGECREVVFVLNSGQSMNTSDPFRVAPESIVWALQNFSSEDEVGVVTFNDEANVIRPLAKIENNSAQNFIINYSGRSNAGAGILTAIDMLTPKFNTERHIIFITDGEITDAQSMQNFKAGLKQAQWLGISIYLVDLRHNVDPKNYREYDAVKILPINYNELLTTIRTILQGDFKASHISLPTGNFTNGTLNFEVPITSIKRVKISLFSSKAGTAYLENIQPNNSFQGDFVKIFDIDSPQSSEFEIDINYPQNSGLTLDVVPTVAGTLQTTSATKFLIKDILKITPIYKEKLDSKILGNRFFDGKQINLQINDKNVVGVIENGDIQIPLDDLDENLSLQKIHFEDVGIIFDGDDTAKIVAPKTHYGAWLLTLAGILIISFLTWRIYKKRKAAVRKFENAAEILTESEKTLPMLEESPKFNRNSAVSYKGKLVLYATKIAEYENFAPREFNLLRMNADKISLSYILENCGITGIFPNAKYIFISPDNRGIFIENESDCTITKRNEIVEKGGKVELSYNDSVNIVSTNETEELIMVYRSLKPV